MKHRNLLRVLVAAAVLAMPGGLPAQRANAPVDLTGYWVSVVSEDWRWRMVTPPKGDFQSLPLNNEARRVANTWDPAKDEAAGEQCKGYGAAGIMRVPARLNITWENDTTLKMDIDAGTQTRQFRFGAAQPAAGEPAWQGQSVAQWEFAGGRGGAPNRPGNLKVVTTRMRPGYLRKNGVPYGPNAVLTEYIHRVTEPTGDLLVLMSIVEDPQYLNVPLVTTTQFRKQANATGWNPTPCSAR